MKFLLAVFDRVQRYPVLFFGAVEAWVVALFHVEADSPIFLALTATVLWLQSAFSLSKKTSDENVAAAKDEVPAEVSAYVGALEHQNVALAKTVIDAPQRPLRARPPADA